MYIGHNETTFLYKVTTNVCYNCYWNLEVITLSRIGKTRSCSNLLALFQTNLPGLQELQKASSFSTNIKRLMQCQQMPCELTKNMCFSLLRELAFSVKFQIINSCMSQRTEKLLCLNSQQIDHGENVCYAAKECPCTC